MGMSEVAEVDKGVRPARWWIGWRPLPHRDAIRFHPMQ
ncbi:hypothetical protein SFR_6903 (plasmid) [Streptomyces sp. FR-008]|nr:hypothetical protein SFR_6903 [Streptomyces sp. FR-008]